MIFEIKIFRSKNLYLWRRQMKKADKIAKEMNLLGSQGKPFAFIIDFSCREPMLFEMEDSSKILWKTPSQRNFWDSGPKPVLKNWMATPVSFKNYKNGFDKVIQHIQNGDTYLLNFTQPTPVQCNLGLNEIFRISHAPYKVLLKDRFVCFSPESFVKIEQGRIYAFPMKGTIDAGLENAEHAILNDSKETAEHNTIVDLIRNDLSLVSENVTVEKFRYLQRIKTNQKDLWQVSSKISGRLAANYAEKIGDIIFTLLPAGSISGAPKKITTEIIASAEKYDRGFYTGIFGAFDGKNLDSCVLIRFIENNSGQLLYKSGGGITFMSDARSEYEEMIKKVYVPVH